MGFKHRSRGLFWCLFMVVMVLFGSTKGDIKKDKDMCGDQLVGLVGCLPYVGGEAKVPTRDCCSGIKQVLAKSMVCLCILVKDHDDPSLGLKINETLALNLPDLCHTPVNISECISLLHLQPGSPAAKLFEDYAKETNNKNTTIALPGDNARNSNVRTSDWGGRKAWLGLDIACLFFVIVMLKFRC